MRILKRAISICTMNLLDKKNILVRSGLVLLLIPFFFACDDPGELGIQVEGNDQNISVKDTTIALPFSTILIDSLRTSGFSTILVGNAEDSVTGAVSCIGYTQYSPSSGTFPGDTLEFESASLKFHINEVRTIDNILSGHIDVHESSDTLYSQVVYLADREVAFDPTPITQVDYSINVDQDSVLSIPLNDLGEELFNKMVRYDADEDYKDSIQRNLIYFPPLVLKTTSSNSGLMSLSLNNDSSAIFVKMKSPKTDSTYSFKLNFNGRGEYTYIEREKTGAKLSSLTEEYVSNFTPGNSYGSMVDGTYVKLNLDPLKTFIEQNPQLIVNNARLTLSTTDYDSDFIIPFTGIRFFYIRNGKISGPGSISTNTRFNSVILSDASYANSGSSDYLSMVHEADSSHYAGEVTLFTQIIADNAFAFDLDEVVILNPTPVSIKKSIITKSELVIYYTNIK